MPKCEGCEDGVPLNHDPVTGLCYHNIKDPIGGRTTNEVCTSSKTQQQASRLIHMYGRDGALKAAAKNLKKSVSFEQEGFWERVAELIEEATSDRPHSYLNEMMTSLKNRPGITDEEIDKAVISQELADALLSED